MRIGVDTGGTFTDCVVFEGTRVKVLKVLSTPENAARAISFDMGGTSTDVSLLDGAPRTNLCLEALQRYSTALMREALLRIPDGEYRAEDYLDDDGFDSRPELFASPRLGRCGKTPWGRRHRSRNRIPDRRPGEYPFRPSPPPNLWAEWGQARKSRKKPATDFRAKYRAVVEILIRSAGREHFADRNARGRRMGQSAS